MSPAKTNRAQIEMITCPNGQRAGAIWHPFCKLDVTPFLGSGANQLKIIVSNTAINASAAQPRPDCKPLTARYGEWFKPQDIANLNPLPSGLTGPDTLVPETITQAGVPEELNLYQKGRHGLGLPSAGKGAPLWDAACLLWLRNRHFLDTP